MAVSEGAAPEGRSRGLQPVAAPGAFSLWPCTLLLTTSLSQASRLQDPLCHAGWPLQAGPAGQAGFGTQALPDKLVACDGGWARQAQAQ